MRLSGGSQGWDNCRSLTDTHTLTAQLPHPRQPGAVPTFKKESLLLKGRSSVSVRRPGARPRASPSAIGSRAMECQLTKLGRTPPRREEQPQSVTPAWPPSHTP